MPCVALPNITVPTDGINLYLPTFSISIPDLGADICCKFALPIAFAAMVDLNALIPAGLSAVMAAAVVLIGEIVDLLNALLDQIRLDCPLNE